jgi:iron-sulfur cluster assembly protein
MIQLTASAANALRSAISGAANPMAGLRLQIETGGCAGYKYKLGLVPEGAPGDLRFDTEGVAVFVSEDSLGHLDGLKVDFVINEQGAGFTFDNPAATKSCSCGKSFG